MNAAGGRMALLKIARDRTDARRQEEELREITATLESRVAERTADLSEANRALLAEMRSREAAETQVRQLQKMEAVGQLTGGIAHDFNNMLAIVIGSLNLIQRRLAKGDTNIDKYIEGAIEGATRAATLTSRLLAFSRQQPLSPEPVDVNRLVAGMSELLRRTIGEEVRLETVLAGGLWRSHADPSQLENAILNLAVNARDAMPGGGKLTIETANAYLDEAYAAENGGLTPGQYTMLAVTDTGGGMTPEVIAKAFEPFFTTKDVGRGTGLGLSQVYGFVRQSGGHVKIYSEAGQGTSVKLYLPRFVGAEERPAAVRDAERLTPAGHPREIVLVVEDEDRVRQFAVEALRELGYTTLHAEGAASALRVLDAHPDVTLLLTDIVMPDVNGRRLADEALKRRPTLKVLYMTGFTRNAVVHNGVLDPGVNFLQKPFTLDQLAGKVRAVLGAPPG
jgi:signal transduction histidine kinase/CheY-like chemotaxis protein